MEPSPASQSHLARVENSLDWTRAFEEQRTIQRLTGGELSANSMTRANDALANQMVSSLNNLALAAVQKNETLEQLWVVDHDKNKIY